ncbi:MAG: ABC transporter substrate-binding protein, partial [Woeseiaceae bacterium]
MNRVLLATLATAALTSACGDGSAPEAVRGVTDTEIVLGSHTDLSGPVAILGVDGANGARMRFEEANEAGGIHGRKIRFIIEDS